MDTEPTPTTGDELAADLRAAMQLIRAVEALDGDPFRPFSASMDYTNQVEEFQCFGCRAVGHSKWPEWKLEMSHEADCKWLAWRRLVGRGPR